MVFVSADRTNGLRTIDPSSVSTVRPYAGSRLSFDNEVQVYHIYIYIYIYIKHRGNGILLI